MKYLILKKENLTEFIKLLLKKHKVVAPVAKGFNNFSFEEISSADKIALNYIPTIIPPKKYFMPQYETLLEYDLSQNPAVSAIVDCEDILLFGVHTCDLAGIQCLNVVFSDRPKDQNYLVRKSKITIIGLECNDYCDEYASCALMDNHKPNGGYELCFTDLGDEFIVHVFTQYGEELTQNKNLFTDPTENQLRALEELQKKKKTIFHPEVDIERNKIPLYFQNSANSKIWEDLGNRCLACGNCTNVCPTCYCFDVMDEPNLDLKTGNRIRVWDSCQNERFAKVAGGESFRKERSQRKKHRFFRKFKYPVERYMRFFCTGCGRCSRACMAKINLKETLSAIAKENKIK